MSKRKTLKAKGSGPGRPRRPRQDWACLPAPEPAAPRNQAALAALEEMLEQQVHRVIGVPAAYTHPITYVYTRAGAYEVRTTSAGRFVARLEPGPEDQLTTGVALTHGLLPFALLRQALAFFRLAYEHHRSEALYMVLLDPARGVYVPYVPRQRVSGSSVQELDPKERPEGLPVVAHIHSHPRFGGHFSGVDDGDDRACLDAAIFGVLGHIDRPWPEMSWRINVGGTYVPLEWHQIFASPLDHQEPALEVPAEWLERLEVHRPAVPEIVSWRDHWWHYYHTVPRTGPEEEPDGGLPDGYTLEENPWGGCATLEEERLSPYLRAVLRRDR